MESQEMLQQEFNEALQHKNERVIEEQKQVLRDKTAQTRVDAESAYLQEEMLEEMEHSEDMIARLKRQILRKKIIFGVLVAFCIIVAVARFVSWSI